MKNIKIFLFFLLSFLIFSNYSSAFLITPSKYEIDFQSNSEKILVIGLINNRKEDIILDTYIKTDYLHSIAKEELKNAFSLNISQVHFKESDNIVFFALNIEFPEKLSLNGIHDLRVGAVEAATEGQIAFRAANEARILIKNGEGDLIIPLATESTDPIKINESTLRPQPEKSLRYDVIIEEIKAEDVFSGEKSDINIKVRNNEEFNVNINTLVNILMNKTVINSINLNSITLNPLKTTNLQTFWDTKNAPIGEYSIEGTIFFQGGSDKASITMRIKPPLFLKPPTLNIILVLLGLLLLLALIIIAILFILSGRKKGIEILSIKINDTIRSNIKEIIIEYINHDNKDYYSYVSLNTKDKFENLIDSINSENEYIRPKERDFLEFYWRIDNPEIKFYTIEIIVKYNNKKTEKIINFEP